jgi:hypothetical protein
LFTHFCFKSAAVITGLDVIAANFDQTASLVQTPYCGLRIEGVMAQFGGT